MTPPVQQHVLERSTSTLGSLSRTASGSARLRPADVVSLFDAWALLAVLWVSRMVTGNLDPAVALFGLASFAMILSPKLQRERLSGGALDDAASIFTRVWFAYAIASAVTLVAGVGQPRALLAVAAAAAPALVLGRAWSHKIERSMRSSGSKQRTLIVGGGAIARRVIDTLDTHDEYGLEVISAADDDAMFSAAELGTRFLGGLSDLPDLVRSHQIEVVIVAFSSGDQSSMIDTIRAAMAGGASVWVVPRFFELGSAGGEGDHLWGLPVVRLQPPARSKPGWVVKRTLDFVLAALGVVVTAPLMGIIALATLIESGRPLLHKQQRVGIDGRPFNILKFRTMVAADEQTISTEWGENSARITRVGKILRDTGLDEIPQLFNILKGEMSLVGPRPERPYFVDLFSELYPHYDARHRLPAGVTGWAQIHGLRGDTSIEERAAFDNFYIENWSLSQDLKILLKTLPTFVRKQ